MSKAALVRAAAAIAAGECSDTFIGRGKNGAWIYAVPHAGGYRAVVYRDGTIITVLPSYVLPLVMQRASMGC